MCAVELGSNECRALVKDYHKASGSLPAPRSRHTTTFMKGKVFFAHLVILEDPDHHQKLTTCSFYHPKP